MRDGVDVRDVMTISHKGPSCDRPYNVDRFPGAVLANRVPPSFTEFGDTETPLLIGRGCVVKWVDVRSPAGAAPPHWVMVFEMEEMKPGLIYVGSEVGCMAFLDDLTASYHILLGPSSGPLFGFTLLAADYSCDALA